MAWKIFIHAVRMVFNNPVEAVKISLVPFVVMFALTYFSNYYLVEQIRAGEIEDSITNGSYPFFSNIISLLILLIGTFILTSWIAVSWHRYVLLEEKPTGYMPTWHHSKILSYFWKFLWITLLLVICMIPLSLVFGVFIAIFTVASMSAPMLYILAIIPMIAAIVYLLHRFSLCLPSVAVGKQMTVSESWAGTAKFSGEIAKLSLIVCVASGIVMIIAIPFETFGIVYEILTLAFNWVSTLIAASLLTTLYGVIIEGREVE